MFDRGESNVDRARLRLRDVGAAWLLVMLFAVAIWLPGVLTAVEVNAVHAADVARDEVAVALHGLPRLLQRS